MKKLIFTLFVFFLPLSVWSQFGYPLFNNVDDRSNAMGKQGITGAKGADAIFSNPALLTNQNTMHLTLGGRLRGHLVKDEIRDATSDLSGNSYEAYGLPHIKLTKLGFGMPIVLKDSDVKLGVGVGYYTPLDFGMNLYEEESNIQQSGSNEITTKVHGGLSVLSPTASLGYKDLFFAGFSVNMALLSTFSSEAEEDITGNNSSNITRDTEYESGGSFVTLGLAGRPLANLLISIRFTPSFDFDLEEGDVEENDNGTRTRNEVPDQQIEYPSVFAAGLEYQVSPAFIVAAGYQNRKFSDFEFNNAKSDLEDGHALSLGFEWITGSIPFGVVFLQNHK